jgi:D-alanyl-D-alanine carboxypeptidase
VTPASRAVPLLLAVWLAACSNSAAPAAGPASPPPAPAAPAPPLLASLSEADLDGFIASVVNDTHAIGVTVGVMRGGKVIFAKGFGLASTESKVPVTPETLFAIGSVTKQFTCATALLLEQEHKLSFDDRVARYAPALTRAADITIRDLGNHVSGYRDYYPLDFVERPMAQARPSTEVVKDFASRPLDFEPGSRYSYSNTGYLLLGQIVEMAGHEPFAAALERRILKPLKLAHTRFEPTRGEPGLAEGYTPLGLGAAERSIPEGVGWIGAAGGLWSTPRDLMAWQLALMDGKVVSAESLQTMSTPRRLTGGRTSAYGCGLQIRDRGPLLVLAHSGGVSGFGSRTAFIPATRSGVVVMANSDWSGGVLDAVQDAVLAKLMPTADAPVIAGKPARAAALEMLDQIRAGTVDRSQLSEEYSAFLSPSRLAALSKSLGDAGPVGDVEAGPIVERGGMEVSSLRLRLGDTRVSTLMYRTPDGKVQEFLVNRR